MSKRPLLRPAIASKYAGQDAQKVVYVSTRTPFISAVKRVRSLLAAIGKRSTQSAIANSSSLSKNKNDNSIDAAIAAATTKWGRNADDEEEVAIKATGKAIEKGMNLALFFAQQPDCRIRIRTGSVNAIDDVEFGKETHKSRGGGGAAMEERQEEEEVEGRAEVERNRLQDHNDDVTAETVKEQEEEEDLPETRIRTTGLLEVFVSLR